MLTVSSFEACSLEEFAVVPGPLCALLEMWRLIHTSQALTVQRGECSHAQGADGQAHWSSCLLVLPWCYPGVCAALQKDDCTASSRLQVSRVPRWLFRMRTCPLYLVHCSAERTLQRFVSSHIDSWNQGEFLNSMSILAQTATFKI